MASGENKYVRIQICISLVTLLLTPLFSSVVVYFQLSKQHQFWAKQREVIRSDDIETRKLQLLADLSTAYSKYKNCILNYHYHNMESIHLQARLKLAEDTKLLFFDTLLKLRPSSEEFKSIHSQLLQDFNDYLDEVRQLSSCLTSISVTYSEDVASKV